MASASAPSPRRRYTFNSGEEGEDVPKAKHRSSSISIDYPEGGVVVVLWPPRSPSVSNSATQSPSGSAPRPEPGPGPGPNAESDRRHRKRRGRPVSMPARPDVSDSNAHMRQSSNRSWPDSGSRHHGGRWHTQGHPDTHTPGGEHISSTPGVSRAKPMSPAPVQVEEEQDGEENNGTARQKPQQRHHSHRPQSHTGDTVSQTSSRPSRSSSLVCNIGGRTTPRQSQRGTEGSSSSSSRCSPSPQPSGRRTPLYGISTGNGSIRVGPSHPRGNSRSESHRASSDEAVHYSIDAVVRPPSHRGRRTPIYDEKIHLELREIRSNQLPFQNRGASIRGGSGRSLHPTEEEGDREYETDYPESRRGGVLRALRRCFRFPSWLFGNSRDDYADEERSRCRPRNPRSRRR
ncbi:hypothetical protein F5Y10DRAFT_246858 [Nemania abortiva]|nr:hypothetical protein F5Y10DRAFT_246858 [Nemania abortiva]